MRKMTKIEIELISSLGMYFFIDKGMRGGTYCIAKRHSKANNKYMQSYDNKKKQIYYVFRCKYLDNDTISSLWSI